MNLQYQLKLSSQLNNIFLRKNSIPIFMSNKVNASKQVLHILLKEWQLSNNNDVKMIKLKLLRCLSDWQKNNLSSE